MNTFDHGQLVNDWKTILGPAMPAKDETVMPITEDATKLRRILDQLGWSQRHAANELGISTRLMRHYCAGHYNVPPVVWHALRHIIILRETEATNQNKT